MAEINAPAPTPEDLHHVIVRSYPKVVYFYLTWIASIVCGLLQPESLTDASQGLSITIGQIWMALFTFNVLVISFEFSRIRSVAISFLIIAFILAASQFGWLGNLTDFLTGLSLVMNKAFYFTIGIIFTLIFLLVFINTRFSYWEIQPNEILHHHGFLGDVHRYPTRGLRMKKEITDVLEYILLRAGTLVLDPQGEERPIVLENVIGLNQVEDKIQRLLGTMKVRVDAGKVGGLD
ncbi:MAG: hypothetical protein ACYTGZ_02050 [Planctomycetota bacterium]|jgi:hypothetical protein